MPLPMGGKVCLFRRKSGNLPSEVNIGHTSGVRRGLDK